MTLSSNLALVELLLLAKRQLIQAGESHGLSVPQCLTLLLLDRPLPMSSLGKTLHCDPSNVTGIIDGLEEKGLAKRFENPKDRRVKMVEAGDTGLKVRATLLSELIGPGSSLLSNLTPDEAKQFMALAGKITSADPKASCD